MLHTRLKCIFRKTYATYRNRDFRKMSLKLLPLHKHPEYVQECCELINSEWKRSTMARMRSLENSSDTLPTCLILVQDNKLIGHAKLSVIPSLKQSCFLESVIITKELRGRGLGSFLMKQLEDYCRNTLKLTSIHLSTKGQEDFYFKLGYKECKPVSIYGNWHREENENVHVSTKPISIPNTSSVVVQMNYVPKPPPIPSVNNFDMEKKTFMNKVL